MRRAYLLAIVAACGGKISGTTEDAAAPPDSAVIDAGSDQCVNCPKPDAGHDSGYTGMCPTPADVSLFVPETLPPSSKHQNQCTQAQLDLYHKCVITNDMSACMQVQQAAMTTFKNCLVCLETTSMDAKWGPLVCKDAMTCTLNVEGCFNLAVNQMGPMSCGQLLHASMGCQNLACEDVCVGDAQGMAKCMQMALATQCKKYGDAFTMQCGALSSPDLLNCFRQQNETDSKALRVRMDTYFCGM